MTPVSTLVRTELGKLLMRPMVRILALGFVGISVLVYGTIVGLILVGESSISQDIDAHSLRENILLSEGIFFGGTLVSIVGSICLIILAAGSIGSEFTWATFRTSLFMGVSRSRLLAAKFLTLGVISLIATLLGLATTIGLSLVSEIIVGRGELAGRDLSVGFVGDLLLTVGVAVIVILIWGLISMGITLATRSLATGLGITLVLSFLGGQIALLIGQLGTAGSWVSRVFPNTATNEIGTLLSTDAPVFAATDWVWISANILGWAVLILAVSLTRFRSMDLLSTS